MFRLPQPRSGPAAPTPAEIAAAVGAAGGEVAELLAYAETRFDPGAVEARVELPLPDEPFVSHWRRLARRARRQGVFEVLAGELPQLAFPVRSGMSRDPDYRSATLEGVEPAGLPGAVGLGLRRPEAIELTLHASPAGAVPVLVAPDRDDFVALVRALAWRNEPAAVPAAQGAAMIAGYNNWSRLRALRRRWRRTLAADRETRTWGEELRRLRAHKELYQDRFIVLSDGPYSAVPGPELGLDGAEWRRLSRTVRLEHECTHYFTRRLYRSMRNHLLDELIADYCGLVAATGRFRAGWFLRFLGLRGRAARGSGRIALYRGDPPLSDGAFAALARLVESAADALERFDRGRPLDPGDLGRRGLRVAALCGFTLLDLAAPGAPGELAAAEERLRRRLSVLL